MVSHQRLIQKLEGYGIYYDLLIWIDSFLNGRRQRVVLDDEVSDWVEVTSRVSQWSVLAPLMFEVFINDLPKVTEGYCKLYADESKIIRNIEYESHVESLHKDIDSVTKSTKEWLMKLHSSKCKVIHFGN